MISKFQQLEYQIIIKAFKSGLNKQQVLNLLKYKTEINDINKSLSSLATILDRALPVEKTRTMFNVERTLSDGSVPVIEKKTQLRTPPIIVITFDNFNQLPDP